jgi:hypothetical protein
VNKTIATLISNLKRRGEQLISWGPKSGEIDDFLAKCADDILLAKAHYMKQ